MVEKNNFLFNDASVPLEIRLDDLMNRLTLEEKISLIPTEQAEISRLGIHSYNIGSEGAHGFVDREGHGTVFPQTIALASTWDRDLLHKTGRVIGREARAYYNKHKTGGLSLWFPTIDMERDPRWGRTEEGYGEDPYLAGELASEIISGAQGDDSFYLQTSCAPKHFFANNNEKDRGICSNSIDARCMHEYYLEPFRRVFKKARPFSIMTAYNKVNGIPMMLHPAVQEIIKKQWGLEGRGHIVTDGGAVSMTVTMHHYFDEHAQTVAAAFRAGSDSMTDLPSIVIPAVKDALDQGLVTEAELDKHVRNIMRVRFRFGYFDNPSRCPYDTIGDESLMTEESARLARRAASESVVLLKNDALCHDGRKLLPLLPGTCGKVAVIGVHADTVYRDWYAGNPPYTVKPLDALRKTYGASSIVFEDGRDRVSFSLADGTPIILGQNGILEAGMPGDNAAVFVRGEWGWGADTLYCEESATYLQTVDSLPTDHQPSADEMDQFRKEGSPGKVVCSAESTLNWFVSTLFNIIPCGKSSGRTQNVMLRSWNSRNIRCAHRHIAAFSDGEPDVLVMHIERSGIGAAEEVAAAADAVLLFCGNDPVINGKEEVDRPSLALPSYQRELVRAVCHKNSRTALVVISGYPYAMKEEAGLAAAVLWCGHGMQEEGNAIADVVSGAVSPAGRLPLTWYASDRDLGSMTDYDIISSEHTYQYFRGVPLYPFGHGLSYSSFVYSQLRLSRNVLDEKGLDVTVDVTNTGICEADEVVELYLSPTGTRVKHPLKMLRGFERMHIKTGGTETVHFAVTSMDAAIWDVTREKFCVENGMCIVSVGASSSDIRLSQTVPVCGEDIPPRDMRRGIDAWTYDSALSCVLGERRGSPVPAVFSVDGYGELVYRACDFRCRPDEFSAEICAQGNASVELHTETADGPAVAVMELPNTGDDCAVPGKQQLPAWTRIVLSVHGLHGVEDLYVVLHGACGIQTIAFS